MSHNGSVFEETRLVYVVHVWRNIVALPWAEKGKKSTHQVVENCP